ncbi:multidrug resistance protein [Alicyclobacillus acidoterrestris]|nr:multidrug resistance protein [Alicyclobacillus acidoterrestris]
MNNTSHNQSGQMIPRYVVISILTFLTIAPQYALNVSFILNQSVIQNNFQVGTYALSVPSLLSNLGFALGVPLGPALSHHFGLRRSYLTLVLLFTIGALISGISGSFWTFAIGRIIEGLSAGCLFLIILPISLMAFPNHVRNWFLLLAIGGLFGATAFGTVFGTLSMNADIWRLMYLLFGVPALICYFIGSRILPKEHIKEHHQPFDWAGFLLFLGCCVFLIPPLANVEEWGMHAPIVWPFLILSMLFFIAFIAVELVIEHPIVHYRSLHEPKQLFGTAMAWSSHIALIGTLIGTAGMIQNVIGAKPHALLMFAISFLIGVLIAGFLSAQIYDYVGAGILGMIGSVLIIAITLSWHHIQPDISLGRFDLEGSVLGACTGVVLVAGALGTAMAGDIHEARLRSISLHTVRNLIGAIATPVFAWLIYTEATVNFERMRLSASMSNPYFASKFEQAVQLLMGQGVSQQKAQELVLATVAQTTKANAVLHAYQHLFVVLTWVGGIMLIMSIGMTATGKGRRLVQKAAPPSSHHLEKVK